MNDTQKNNLFYVCSLIEFIGRKTKNRRATIVKILGKKELVMRFLILIHRYTIVLPNT